MELAVGEDKLKSMLEEVLIKMIREKREFFYELLVEALEDAALGNAIHQGRQNRFVSEERIMKILEG